MIIYFNSLFRWFNFYEEFILKHAMSTLSEQNNEDISLKATLLHRNLKLGYLNYFIRENHFVEIESHLLK